MLIMWLLLGATGKALADSERNAASLYEEHCGACHGRDGRALPGVPDIVRSKIMLQPDSQLFEAVRDGRGVMPGFEGLLDSNQILAVIRYMRILRR